MALENYQMLAKTLTGLEEVLKKELISLGAQNVETVIRGVRFSGSKDVLYKANYCCRTALRILRIVDEFKAENANELYENIKKIDWTTFFDLKQSFAVFSTVTSEAFNNSMFVSLKSKDAIVDLFREKTGKRPSVNAENPDVRVHVHVSNDLVSVSLDSSGESLHKRGYRVAQNEASMSEVLAAGLLLLANWRGQSDFYDPMCGSGTIPIEAALIAKGIPPGMFRKSFAFESWKDFDPDVFEEVYDADYEKDFPHTIYASDISPANIRLASENARNAGLKKHIQFSVADFATVKPAKNIGFMMMNPPYGQRMNDRSVEPLYSMIGDQLKQNFIGFKAWIFSNSEEGFKRIGLRFAQRYELYNGALPCELRSFEVYEGSKKQSKQGYNRGYQDDRYDQRPSRPYGNRDQNQNYRPDKNN
jgi:putative N6-adenine-specific DNA methylase